MLRTKSRVALTTAMEEMETKLKRRQERGRKPNRMNMKYKKARLEVRIIALINIFV